MRLNLLNRPATWIVAPVLMAGLTWAAIQKGIDPIPEADAERIITKLNDNARKDKAVDWDKWINDIPSNKFESLSVKFERTNYYASDDTLEAWSVSHYNPEKFQLLVTEINDYIDKLKTGERKDTQDFISWHPYWRQHIVDAAMDGQNDILIATNQRVLDAYANDRNRYFNFEWWLKNYVTALSSAAQLTSNSSTLETIKASLESTKKYYEILRPQLSSFAWTLLNLNLKVDDEQYGIGRSRLLYAQIIHNGKDQFLNTPFQLPDDIEGVYSWTGSMTNLIRIENGVLGNKKRKNITPRQFERVVPPGYLDGFSDREKAFLLPMLVRYSPTVISGIRAAATNREITLAIVWSKLYENAVGHMPDNLEALYAFGYKPTPPVTEDQLRAQAIDLTWLDIEKTASLPFPGMVLEPWTLNAEDLRLLLDVPDIVSITSMTREVQQNETLWRIQMLPDSNSVNEIQDKVSVIQMLWLKRLQSDPRFLVESSQAIDMATSQPVILTDDMLRPYAQDLVRLKDEPLTTDFNKLPIIKLELTIRTPTQVRRIAVPGSKYENSQNGFPSRDMEQFVFPTWR